MEPPPYTPRALSRDLETASIRSAAPSYSSAAPPYQSLIPSTCPAPTPRFRRPVPYIPSQPQPLPTSRSSLNLLRKPRAPASDDLTNPAARHYQSVAHRRASALTIQEQAAMLAAALTGESGIAQMKKKMDAEEREREIRTREDPYLVGEAAAEQNRQERLNKESGYEILELEDKRWDWLLAQMSDWNEREKSWKRFRQELEQKKRAKLTKRWGIRFR